MTKQINVIMGGPSAEHEVSLATGWEMLKYLSSEKYTIVPVIFTRKREFYYSTEAIANLTQKDLSDPHNSSYFQGPIHPAQAQEIWQNCAVALLGLHGEFGEDGRIQGYLEMLGIPYTGSHVFASAVGMHKIAAKQMFEKNGLLTPSSSIYQTDGQGESLQAIINRHGFPCFVKCPQSGSSRLMGRATGEKELGDFVSSFSAHTSQILIEENITGDEYSCPILEYSQGDLVPLPPILIRPIQSDFFDYTAKYTAEACEEIVPAPCSQELTRKIQDIALQAHKILNCTGISRTDMIVAENKIYVLETNTLPGFTSTSLAPKAFVAQGGTYSQLLDILIETGLKRNRI